MPIDLNDLRVFERVAALRNFTAASRDLDLPKSTVSRSIARLEEALAARLLQRTTREVMLTEPGVMLLQRCSDLMGEVERTIQDVGSLQGGVRGTVRISSAIGFGMDVVADLMPRFLVQYPQIGVTLDLSSRIIDLVGEGIDLAIRMGPMPESSAIARRLGTMPHVLCAAPQYLVEHGTPHGPGDLAMHDVVGQGFDASRIVSWRLTRDDTVIEHRQVARISANSAPTVHAIVLGGAGIGLCPAYRCAADVATGRLVRLLPDWTPSPVEVHAVFPSRRQLAPAVRAFINFLADQCRTGEGGRPPPLL